MDDTPAQSLNATELLRNIGHAAHSPISSILNLTEIILTGVDGVINDEVRGDVTDIAVDVTCLQAIFERVLELCRIDSATPILKPVDVSMLARAALREVHPASKMLIDHIPDKLPVVWADIEMLSELVGRLVSHVARFTDEKAIGVSAYASAQHVTLCVGGGERLPEPARAYLVELPNDWFKDELALDVLICRRLAEAQSGELWASHPPGCGIVLNLALPTCQ